MYTKAVRVKAGKVITIAREQATRWVQHYTEVLTDRSLMSLLTQIVQIILTLTLTCLIRLKWRLQQRQWRTEKRKGFIPFKQNYWRFMKQTSYHLRGIQWTCCHICKACTLPIIWQSCQPLLSSAGTIRPTKQLDMANESAHQPSLEPGGERNALTAPQSPSVEKNWSALMISLVLKALLAVIMVSKPEVLLSWLCNIWKS